VTRETTEDVNANASVEAATDIDAFVRAIAHELLGYFARRVTPEEDAADCLSETLLVLWRRHDKFPARHEERRAWSYGIARRVLAAHRRAGIRRLAITIRLREELQREPIGPASNDDSAITALSSLPERDRELVCLIAWEGLGVAEAGAVLGLRPDAARARYSRARRRLRAHLEAP
jgi:RNA polymerase sigma-70 factor, ECF subfamily